MLAVLVRPKGRSSQPPKLGYAFQKPKTNQQNKSLKKAKKRPKQKIT